MILLNNFTGGLALSSSPDALTEGQTRSNRGLSPTAANSFRTRFGSSQLNALSAHSISYFANIFWYGVSTSLYRGSVSKKSGLSGDRLSFTKCPPVAGITDYLFLAGGGTLYKSSSSGTVTAWGLDAPASDPTATANNDAYNSIRNATYIWTQIGATDEYYCELAATGDPSLPSPTIVRENASPMTLGTAVGSLAASEYIYADGGGGFDTIIVRLSDDTDPDGKAAGYVDYSISTTLLSGTYQYLVTYKNSTTGHRSNANTAAASVTVDEQYVDLTAIPDASLIDSQIDKVEIWRTGSNGSLFFYFDQVDAGTTTYSDDGSTDLSSTELPTDNDEPFSYFDDCLGPHNASMFWITRTQSGQRGRLFYSPIGRCESMQGFIEIASDDNPLQRIFRFQGQLGVIAESGIFLVGGDNPYVSREIPACPGTTEPFSVSVTPFGVIYRASDGLRIFDGNSSTLVSPGTVERLFRGEAVVDLSAFSTPLVSTFARDEYYISDGSQSLAVNREGAFRDLGLGLSALYYSEESDQIAATHSSKVVDFEDVLTYNDNGSDISLILEPSYINTNSEVKALLQYLTLDINTNSESVTCTLIIDGTESTLGVFTTFKRQKVFLNVGKPGTVFGIRLTGLLSSAIVEIFSIKPDFYAPK